MHETHTVDAVTVTLNPAIDKTVLIRDFAADKVNRVDDACERPGGKGVNVAAALADFRVAVAVTGFLGRDNAGSFDAMFARRGIGDHFIRVPGQTRTGIKICDPVRCKTTDINFPGLAPRKSDVSAMAKVLERLAIPGRWFVLSGSLPPAMAPESYAHLVALLRRRGAKTLVDTSGEPLRHAVHEQPDIVKPNIHELESLAGERLADIAGVIRTARRLTSGRTELAVVSMGDQGACFVSRDECVVALPPEVEVRSTVGAGDGMVAGIVAARLQGMDLTDTARLATAFSLEVVTRGQSGLGSRAAVNRWRKRVVCRRL